MHGLWAENHTQTSLWRGRLASGRPVKPDARRRNRRANWNSTQSLANMGGSCRSERIRVESKWEISDKAQSGDHPPGCALRNPVPESPAIEKRARLCEEEKP